MPPKKASGDKPVWVLLICGLPGSGKTTLRQRLVRSGWAYVSQDEMATADACEKALVKALKAGTSVVVDRCNVTASDRRLWMQHANRAVDKGLVKGVDLRFEVVWMATPPEVCKERARRRAGHETLSPEKADEVVDAFCRGLKPPEKSGQEPYDAVHVVATSADADVLARRYANPARVDAAVRLALEPVAALAAAAAAAAAEAMEAAAAAPEGAGDDGTQQAPLAGRNVAGTEVFVVRHGERADRARDRDDGWPDDPPLTKTGRETAKRAGCALRSLAAAPWAPVIYSSPYFRCLQTADEIAAELGLHVRVEPGLSEFACQRIFDQQPRLREPQESLASAFRRAEADLAQPAPILPTPPAYAESPREANARVLHTARALMQRHPGQAICLVCHGHSIVELTRRLPIGGAGSVGMNVGYCGLSHIAANGRLIRGLDQSYLKDADGGAPAPPPAPLEAHADGDGAEPAGCWTDGWRWRGSGEAVASADDAADPVDDLLEMSLEVVLERYPKFAELFHRGSAEKQQSWQQGWANRSDEVRAKLRQAHAHGLLVTVA